MLFSTFRIMSMSGIKSIHSQSVSCSSPLDISSYKYNMEPSNNKSHQEDTLINVLSGGKKFIDISEKGIDFNFLGFSAGIDVLAESKPKSVLGGLKAKVSTPWGSTASAGFEGNVGPAGLGGGLSARAALTPDIAAKAGLEGNINTKGINGGVKAGAKSPISGEHIAQLSGEQTFKRSE